MLSFEVEIFKPKGFLSHIEKTWFFSWEYIVYIQKGFKSHIEKILLYPFKLKHLNQKIFLSHIEKTWLFSWEHKAYILMGFKSHIWKKNTGSHPGSLRSWVNAGSLGFDWTVAPAGLLLNPDRYSHWVDPPGRV
jgi:hypothetical protein